MDDFLQHDNDQPDDGSSHGSNRLEWLLLLSESDRIKTVCETGFNFGMSALTFLQWPHVEKVFSFDLMENAFKYRALERLVTRYGDRLEVFEGPTRETLPQFVETHPQLKCDLVFVDGGHRFNDSEIDLLFFQQLSDSSTVVIADDCSASMPWPDRGRYREIQGDTGRSRDRGR